MKARKQSKDMFKVLKIFTLNIACICHSHHFIKRENKNGLPFTNELTKFKAYVEESLEKNFVCSSQIGQQNQSVVPKYMKDI